MSFFEDDGSGGRSQVYDYEAPEGMVLDEALDDMNDETFGGGPVGKDFDFAGNTAKVVGTLGEEQVAYERNVSVPSLAPLPSLWQMPQAGGSTRAVSVQELEGQMLSGVPSGPMSGQMPMQMGHMPPMLGYGMYPPGAYPPWAYPPPPPGAHGMPAGAQPQPGFPGYPAPQGDDGGRHHQQFPPHAPSPQGEVVSGPIPHGPGPAGQPLHVGETPEANSPARENRGDPAAVQSEAKADEAQGSATHQKPTTEYASAETAQEVNSEAQAPYSLAPRPVTSMSVAEARNQQFARAAADRERQAAAHRRRTGETKYNGLMGDWDKNFIMRIQLQQLISQDPYNEDFYYQVHTAIQARNNPHQPLNQFAKTYLFQQGQRGRRNRQENPLLRMQQQVELVVEKVRGRTPKERIVQEGTLGQAKSGTAARPRTALLLPETNLDTIEKGGDYTNDQILASCEKAFDAILELEAHDRARPPSDHEDAAEWATKVPELEAALWEALEVQSPLDSKRQQPFIMMLAHDKGKKLVPRAFPNLDSRSRLTILTRLFHQIDDLDVIAEGSYPSDGVSDLKATARKAVELFSQTVLQPLVQYVSELDLEMINLLVDMLLSSTKDIVKVASTKVGQAFLTILISRAELIRQESTPSESDMANWRKTFDRLFTKLQPSLANLFPPRQVENSYVWHFLASLALASTLEQQRLLVDAVRERIFGTMAEARALPVDIGSVKIANLNLFLNVMGLNATFDDISELQN